MKIEKVLLILEKELKIKAERKSGSFFFICPFHDDKNPSLSLEGKKMFFKCFGCQFKAGNIYQFWSKYKRITIDETFEELAKLGYIKTGKKRLLVEEDNKYKNFLNIVSYIYANNLLSFEGKEVLRYLKNERKISMNSLKEFNIGSSINSKQLVTILQKKENEEFAKISTELGLITTKKEESFDFFWRNQVIIPITNWEGDVVLVASRRISKGDNKYLFLPSSIVCEKSSTIYNYRRSIEAKEDFCYLVEGFFDVLSLYENQIMNCMSLLGTSISNEQLRMIEKTKKKVIVFFDGDKAGREASALISSELIRKNIECEVIETTLNKDPDEICKEKKIEEELKNKTNPFIFSINYYENFFQVKENPQKLSYFVKKISSLFWWSDENVRKFLAEKISEVLSFDYNIVWKLLLKEMEEAEGFEPSRVF